MKNLFIALAALVAVGCSKPEPEPDPTQDYTSFVFEQTIDNLLSGCVVGYFDEEGYCWKLADLGDLERAGQQSQEVVVEDESITEIFLFVRSYSTRTDETFRLQKNKKNVFKLRGDVKGIRVDVNNPKEYPQEKSPE